MADCRSGDILTRILSALVLAPLFLGLAYLGGMPFRLLMTALSLLGLNEFFAMHRAQGLPVQERMGYAWAASLFGAEAAMGEHGLLMAVAVGPCFLILRYLQTPDIDGAIPVNARTVLGLVGFVLPMVFVVRIREFHALHGFGYAIGLLVLIWVQDSAAYFGGKAFGRHKFQPYLSPKKTWEGALIGMTVAMAATVPTMVAFGIQVTWMMVLGLLVVAAGAQLGDLNESLLKRNLGAKDSGTIIPGHGGILDRFDSFTFAAPLMYCVVLHS